MDIFVAALLPMAVVFIMFSLGLGLTPADFARIARRPRAFCIGALNQIVMLPLIAFGIILGFGFTGETAVGLMILAACPGGATSNVITKLANWDVALSVTLTAAFSLTCVISVPLVLTFAVSYFMRTDAPEIDITSTALTAFLLTALPITVGVTLRAFAPKAAAAIDPPVSMGATLLFIAVIAGAIAANWQIVRENFAHLGLGLIAMVAVVSFVSFALSRWLQATDREAKTISVETGVQNGALALAIAGLLVVDGPIFNAYAVPAALYGVVWLGSALPAFLLLARAGKT